LKIASPLLRSLEADVPLVKRMSHSLRLKCGTALMLKRKEPCAMAAGIAAEPAGNPQECAILDRRRQWASAKLRA